VARLRRQAVPAQAGKTTLLNYRERHKKPVACEAFCRDVTSAKGLRQ
jgi:hypothetical protein